MQKMQEHFSALRRLKRLLLVPCIRAIVFFKEGAECLLSDSLEGVRPQRSLIIPRTGFIRPVLGVSAIPKAKHNLPRDSIFDGTQT
ncbi:MAG TPA: hypothetical protein DCZ48_06305 [Methylococcaceae bacterium]|nr:hypothetical protein [Methylococcaceae bacterium]